MKQPKPGKEMNNLWDNGCKMMENIGSPLCDGKNYLCSECRMKVSHFRWGKQEGIRQERERIRTDLIRFEKKWRNMSELDEDVCIPEGFWDELTDIYNEQKISQNEN